LAIGQGPGDDKLLLFVVGEQVSQVVRSVSDLDLQKSMSSRCRSVDPYQPKGTQDILSRSQRRRGIVGLKDRPHLSLANMSNIRPS
jgi:hypothetical protein